MQDKSAAMINTVLVDDEIKSCQVLSKVINSYCTGVKIAGTANNAEEAYSLIRKVKPELVFLDVQMPVMDGFSLLERLAPIDFKVVFITAFDQFALKAIKFSALDYLLKPINIDEVITAVEKYKKESPLLLSGKENPLLHHLLKNITQPEKKIWDTIALPTSKAILYVKLEDILYVEADKNYSTFYLENKEKIIVSYTLKTYEELLCDHHFMRVHHSHIINLKKVKKYVRGKTGYAEMTDGKNIEISQRKKDEFLTVFPH